MYHLFMFDRYYPSGGMEDYAGCYDTLEAAILYGEQSSYDYFQVVDKDFVTVAQSKGKDCSYE